MQAVRHLYGRLTSLGSETVTLLAVMLAAGIVGGPLRGLLAVYLERDLAWAPPAVAALAAARLLPAAVAAPIGGAFADRLGAERTLRLGLVGLPLAALAFLTPDMAALAVLILVVGLAEGLQSTGSQAYLMARALPATIGLASSAFYVGSTLGGALGNLAAGALLPVTGFGGLGLAGLVGGLLLVGAAGRLAPAAGGAARQNTGGTLTAYGRLLRHAPVRDLVLLRFLSTASWGTMSLVLPLLVARLAGDPVPAALFGTVSLAFAVACQLITGHLIDRTGPGRTAVVLAALVPVMGGLAAATSLSLGGFFVAGVLATGAAWSLSVTIMPLLRASAPPESIGQAAGLTHLVWCLAMLAGTLSAGLLLAVGPAAPLLVAAGLNLPTALLAHRLRRHGGR